MQDLIGCACTCTDGMLPACHCLSVSLGVLPAHHCLSVSLGEPCNMHDVMRPPAWCLSIHVQQAWLRLCVTAQHRQITHVCGHTSHMRVWSHITQRHTPFCLHTLHSPSVYCHTREHCRRQACVPFTILCTLCVLAQHCTWLWKPPRKAAIRCEMHVLRPVPLVSSALAAVSGSFEVAVYVVGLTCVIVCAYWSEAS